MRLERPYFSIAPCDDISWWSMTSSCDLVHSLGAWLLALLKPEKMILGNERW
jgi:hypothetical protein